MRTSKLDDINEAYDWYESQTAGLGLEFLRAVEVGLGQIRRAAAPLTPPVLHEATRRLLLRRFPYGIFYKIEGNVIVAACCHTQRGPEVWQSRT